MQNHNCLKYPSVLRCKYLHTIRRSIVFEVTLYMFLEFLLDNVCIESMSVNITRRTLERAHNNVESLSQTINK